MSSQPKPAVRGPAPGDSLHAELDSLFQAALAHHRKGALAEAAELYGRVLERRPRHVDAMVNLGAALKDQGHFDAAEATYRLALGFRPDIAEIHANLGAVLKESDRLDEAVASFEEAVRLKPTFAPAHLGLGAAQRAAGRLEEAAAAYACAIELRGDYAEAHSNLGIVRKEQGSLADAERCFRRAVELKPRSAEIHYNLANALKALGRSEEAVACFRQALDLAPDHAGAHSNLGVTLRQLGRTGEALDSFERAISFQPDYADAHWNQALTWLLTGNFAQGWPAYEWRWRTGVVTPRSFSQPVWDGAPLAGRRILLYAEQGLGDTIQFIRFAPLVKARGGEVIVEYQAPLMRLLETCAGIDRLVAGDRDLPAFDLHAPLMSLPGLFATAPDSIPAEIPYLSAPNGISAELAGALDSASDGRRVGIVWAGNPVHENDANRSCPPEHFVRLARTPGVTLFSLQKGVAGAALDRLDGAPPIVDIAPLLDDFADTAAAIARLDLVVTVDTAIAHLAGALGRPVWLVLPFAPDWRWMLGRDDSPWYPTMRIFRQRTPGVWAEVFDDVEESLQGDATA